MIKDGLWKITERLKWAISEMGMSHPNARPLTHSPTANHLDHDLQSTFFVEACWEKGMEGKSDS